MAQVLEFKLPDLGEGLTEAEIVRWLVQVGDVVAIDQPVVEVETAKAMVEVPCPYGGVVTARFGEEGTELPVGAPLLTVAVGASPSDGPQDGPADRSGAAPVRGAAEGSGNVLVGYGTGEPPARRRRVRPTAPLAPAGAPARPAPPAAVPTRADGVGNGTLGSNGMQGSNGSTVHGTGTGTSAHGTGTLRAEGPVPVISPLVRRLARENGLDLRELTGSGPDGLILRADVEDALRAAAPQDRTTRQAAPAPAQASGPVSSAPAGGIRIPLKGVRGAVADKLSRSRREIPEATCWVDADATELMRARSAMNAAGGPKISSSRCWPASARPPSPASRSSTPRWTRRPGRSSSSTTSTWASRRRPSGASSCRWSGTPTRGTPRGSPPSSPG